MQYNHVTTSAGYASSSAGPVHFGLSVDEQADVIEIRWPSGKIQRLNGVKSGRVLEVKEPGPAENVLKPWPVCLLRGLGPAPFTLAKCGGLPRCGSTKRRIARIQDPELP